MKKVFLIFLNLLPIFAMIGLVSLVKNDYFLTGIYIAMIVVLLAFKRNKNDLLFLFFGFLIMTFFEYFFLLAGVEIFNRNTLFGIMPLWLPFMWAYGFVVIKRAVEIIG